PDPRRPAVPARRGQRAALAPILDAFYEALGDHAQSVLSANLERAGARLVRTVSDEQRHYTSAPRYDEVVELVTFAPIRTTDRAISTDRYGGFSKSVAYSGWRRSMFGVAWFDSRTERSVANLVDEDEGIALWVRLHTGDMPILWSSDGRHYNPDFIVVDTAGVHWVVEVKADDEMRSEVVRAKREAALRWANHVSVDDSVQVQWRYLLVSESDIEAARGSWPAVKALGES
ncbi:MAG: hypothetical protein ACRDGL_00550, partial [Candidatus Limnocylindrales bacterium]